MYVCMYGLKDGWMDGRMNGWIGGWIVNGHLVFIVHNVKRMLQLCKDNRLLHAAVCRCAANRSPYSRKPCWSLFLCWRPTFFRRCSPPPISPNTRVCFNTTNIEVLTLGFPTNNYSDIPCTIIFTVTCIIQFSK